MTHYQLFTNGRAFYTSLRSALQAARQSIHLAYYAFDDGIWARAIGHTLAQKAASGVAVHLMVDRAGLLLENWRHGRRNRTLLAQLAASGVRVTLFEPNGRGLTPFNRLHCKFCAIDNGVVFIGGSNIGDHYVQWRDTNLRITGDLGDGFARLFQLLCRTTRTHARSHGRVPTLQMADIPLLLTLPGRQKAIRTALLELITAAETAVTLRTWYFLPDAEIVHSLAERARDGVAVTVIYSDRTRVPLVDLARHPIVARLARAGVELYPYCGRFMHAKEAWNDRGDVLLGSANLDLWALHTNFECSLKFSSATLARQLDRALAADRHHCPAVRRPTAAIV